MKANELSCKDLMIGDWLLVHHPTMPAECIQISADWIRTIEQINNGLIKEDSPLFRIVEPIPLTKEILEKNGFHRSTDNDYEYVYDYRDDDTIICCPKGTGCINAYGYMTLYIGCTTIEELPIDYVHELQNALRLCGVEIEITI